MRSGHVKINRCLILMLSVILGAYILWNMGVFSWNMIWEEITDMLVRQSAECYLPGMVYVAEDKNGDWKEWLEGKAAELIPLGTYLDEKSEWETEVEDAETIAKILAEQASDENAVDANGALIGEDDSAKTEGVGTGIDVSPEKMGDFNYLLSHFYTVDSSTMIRSDELNGTELMSKDLHIDQETEDSDLSYPFPGNVCGFGTWRSVYIDCGNRRLSDGPVESDISYRNNASYRCL